MKKTYILALMILGVLFGAGCASQAGAAPEDILYLPGATQVTPELTPDVTPTVTPEAVATESNLVLPEVTTQAGLEETIVPGINPAQGLESHSTFSSGTQGGMGNRYGMNSQSQGSAGNSVNTGGTTGPGFGGKGRGGPHK